MQLDVQLRHGFVSRARRGSDNAAFSLDVGFTVDARALALVGPSGSGKTTILNAIAGVFTPDQGRIRLDGMTLLDTAMKINVRQSRRRIGYVFQDGRLFPHLTVRRNLLYGRWFAPRYEHGLGLDDIVALLGIGHLMDRNPDALSGGEKQRVAIGRALLAKPRLLLMDEPLAALDLERRSQILTLIERLRDELGLPMVLVSHDPGEVARVATSIVDIRHGRLGSIRSMPNAPSSTVTSVSAEIIHLPVGTHRSAHFRRSTELREVPGRP